ncbi:tail fiber assembly protein [Trabulsiella guamensis ATCC 49490]|uniref:Tail fiber assembly protein n=1 Tax=Trabulsiella guamensis ATCC 49490 TaxID=1005994 RepID=A0A084ZC59_9ENTR|nr:tail assembly chaperone [Trabulsiella guamensis]KFB95053.1 tail fiber assembly protein [Trabulsiella guamensis ATCC 49490]
MSDFNYSFSPSNCAFYANSLKETYYAPANDWPSDAFEVSDDVTNEFTAQPPNGKKLGVVDGLPAWIDIPPPTREEAIVVAVQKKTELLKAAQATIINWQSKLLLGVISDDEKTSLIAWLAYIDELTAVDTTDPNWPVPPAL